MVTTQIAKQCSLCGELTFTIKSNWKEYCISCYKRTHSMMKFVDGLAYHNGEWIGSGDIETLETSTTNPLQCNYCGSYLPEDIGYKCPNCGGSEIVKR